MKKIVALGVVGTIVVASLTGIASAKTLNGLTESMLMANTQITNHQMQR